MTAVKIRWEDQSVVWDAATGMSPYGIASASPVIFETVYPGQVGSRNEVTSASDVV